MMFRSPVGVVARYLLLGAALACAGILWAHWWGGALFSDGRQYFQTDLLNDHGRHGQAFLYGIQPASAIYRNMLSRHMPLFPMIAALLCHHTPEGFLPLAVLLLGLASLLLAFNLGRLLHSKACGLAAVALAIPWVPQGMNEQLVYAVFLLLIANLLAWRARGLTPWRSAWLGLAIGLSLLLRSPLFLFPVFLIVYEWVFRGSVLGKSWWKSHLLLIAIPLLILLPWMHMNWTLQGRWIPLEDGRADCNVVTGALGLVTTVEGDFRKLAELTQQDDALAWAFWEVLRHPLRFLSAYAVRMKYVFLLHPVLLLMGALTVWICRRREDHRQLGLLAAYFIGIHCLMSIEARYFLPLWPLCAVLAADLFAQGVQPLRERPARAAPMGLVWACLAPVAAMGLFTLGMVGTYGGRASSAEDRLEEALASHPEDSWLWSEKGRRCLMSGDASGAAKAFARALSLEHQWERTFEYAWALWAKGSRSGDLVFRIPFPGGAPSGHLLKMFLHLSRGEREAAAQAFRTAKRMWTASLYARGVETLFDAESTVRLRTGPDRVFTDFVRSLMEPLPARKRSVLASLLVQGPEVSPEMALMAAEVAFAAGDGRKAGRILGLLEEKSLGFDESRRMAILYGKLGETRRALALFKPLEARAPRDAGLLLDMAEVAAESGAIAQSSGLLARVESIGPGRAERYRSAILYQRLGESQKALDILEGLVRRHPAQARYWSDRGVIKAMMGNKEEAIRDLRAALRLDPSFVTASLTLGGLYAAQGRTADAREVYEKALAHPRMDDEQPIYRLIRQEKEKLRSGN